MESTKEDKYVGHVAKEYLTPEEIERMNAQDSRLVPEFKAMQLEKDAKKHWDLFYKRNEVRFFKDRHWTTREFEELLGLGASEKPQCLIEVGCGVGNLIYPLLEDNVRFSKIYACDLSPRAVEFVKVSILLKIISLAVQIVQNPNMKFIYFQSHRLYDSNKIKAFQTDITSENCFNEVDHPIDIATLVFVLSAIHPNKFKRYCKSHKAKFIIIIAYQFCINI